MKSALDALPHWRVSIAKGRTIYIEGEPSSTLYRVERGCVRLLVDGTDGARQIISFQFPTQLFGYCLDTRNTSAEAVTDVELTAFPISAVIELGARNQKAAIELLDTANEVVRHLAHHLQGVSHLAADARVMWFLERLSRQPGIGDGRTPPTIRLPMTYGDVAAYLNLTPQTLSRVFRHLEAAQSIHRTGNRVLVVDALAAA
jgi:CRP-like cAMP-binding protein